MEGWGSSTIGEACHVVNGGTPKTKVGKYWGGCHAWITPAEMGKLQSPYLGTTRRTLTDAGLDASSASLLQEQSVIISSRAPIGHLVINTVPMATNQGCKGLTPKAALSTKFLFFYLYHKVDYLNSLGTGATFKELSATKLKAVPIPLPPLPEQERIVAILDEAFAAIATATANAEKNLANARELFLASLDSAFGSRSKQWEGKLVSEIADHRLGKMLDKRKNTGEPKDYLRNINVRWFDFDLEDMLQMRFESNETEKYSAVRGDLMICEGGYPGRAAIWADDEPIYFQKAIHRVRFHNQKHTQWFLFFLYYLDGTNQLRNYFTGAGIQHLTGQSLAKVSVPIPPDHEIDDHLTLFERYQAASTELERLSQTTLDHLTNLKQSLLHKAFTGELTADKKAADRTLSEAGL